MSVYHADDTNTYLQMPLTIMYTTRMRKQQNQKEAKTHQKKKKHKKKIERKSRKNEGCEIKGK